MSTPRTISYYGWSSLAIDTPDGSLFFDPFFRHYCGAQWFALQDFLHAKYVCVTHGHEEHFLDVPEVARRSGATVIGPKAVTGFLRRRSGLPDAQLATVEPDGASLELPGFRISTFRWQHRDINLFKALTKAVFHGNATQLSWAWSSATNAPFHAPYTGYHVELPDGRTILNYNEGFNTKMTDREIADLGRRLRTDVLLAGMQLDFVDDVARGARALDPGMVVLYPPHDKFHAMMGVSSTPWQRFADTLRRTLPSARVVVAEPGTVVDLDSGELLPARQAMAA